MLEKSSCKGYNKATEQKKLQLLGVFSCAWKAQRYFCFPELVEGKAKTASRGREIFMSRKILVTTKQNQNYALK
jgi:hypothetical protein